MKILVTTDFSVNSKSAIRFALNIAKQEKNIEVVFYYSISISKPTRWGDNYFKTYLEDETKRLSSLLEKFVKATVGKNYNQLAKVNFVVQNVLHTDRAIAAYAEKNKVHYICIATRGAGLLRKIVGTHTEYLVNNCAVPVMVIPSQYKAQKINQLTYLSDFENLKKELQKVKSLSESIHAKVKVLHYHPIVADKKRINNATALLSKPEFENVSLDIQQSKIDFSLVERVSQYIKKSKPELLVMFSKKQKGFFESIFLPSKSTELTYSTTVPVLIYAK